jgi:hypothetical protein
MIKKFKQNIVFNYNPDVDNEDSTEKLQIKDKIVTFLNNMHEVQAAKFVENEMLSPQKMSTLNNEDVLDETKKISELNKKILDKLYESYRGENNPFYGKSHSEESINRIREKSGNATRGLNYDSIYGEFSQDQKNKRSKSAILQWNSISTEERKNIIAKVSDSLKKSGKRKGSNNPASYPIIVDGVFYSSVREAITEFGYSYYKKLYSKHNIIKLIKIK